ncbi:hypothetical protein A2U01_0112461, partial [Trifolium medium]|nr:hypothetical protein [Trifolium medium]
MVEEKAIDEKQVKVVKDAGKKKESKKRKVVGIKIDEER